MAADKLLLEDGSGGYQLEDGSGNILLTPVSIAVTGLSCTGTVGTVTFSKVEAPPVTTTAETPAGRKKRTRYVVRIDGEEFEVQTLAEALALLAQAKALALKHAQQVARQATEVVAKPTEIVKRVKIPVVTAEGPGLVGAAREAQAIIEQTYKAALRDAEIALHFRIIEQKEAKKKRDQEDDEDALLMLMW